MEDMITFFLKSMSKEEKQRMIREFVRGLSPEERMEMMQLVMPIMMKDMNPGMMMSGMMENMNEGDCQKMMKEMPPDMRERCRKMMSNCMKTLQEMEKSTN